MSIEGEPCLKRNRGEKGSQVGLPGKIQAGQRDKNKDNPKRDKGFKKWVKKRAPLQRGHLQVLQRSKARGTDNIQTDGISGNPEGGKTPEKKKVLLGGLGVTCF